MVSLARQVARAAWLLLRGNRFASVLDRAR